VKKPRPKVGVSSKEKARLNWEYILPNPLGPFIPIHSTGILAFSRKEGRREEGLRVLSNEAYQEYTAMTKDEAQRRLNAVVTQPFGFAPFGPSPTLSSDRRELMAKGRAVSPSNGSWSFSRSRQTLYLIFRISPS
jgi:hypothetical protein